MRHVILLFGAILMVTSCTTMQGMPMGGNARHKLMVAPRGPLGTVIRIKMQQHCPVSAIDFGSGSQVASCQVGNVLMSSAACRASSTEEKPVVVVWEAHGQDQFEINFVNGSPLKDSANPVCAADNGNYQCKGTMQEGLTPGTEYEYHVTHGTCIPLDPYIISF